MRKWTEDPAGVRPMLATTVGAPLDSPTLVYEPKYDGIRALASVTPGSPPRVRLWSRLGNEKTAQFPEIVDALRAWALKLDRPVLLDGEIVALDEHGEPSGFQNLQGRIHLKAPRKGAPHEPDGDGAEPSSNAGRPFAGRHGIAFITFELLRNGDEDIRPLPLRERRSRLERLMNGVRDTRLRISEQATGDGRELHARAKRSGWEGLVAKSADSAYQSGRRSPEWRKLKLVRQQSAIIAGWTEPRGSRPFFGALLLGVHDESGRLHYIGHTGAGFTDAELGRVWKALQALKTKTSPFAVTPRTNERAHWVKPRLLAEVKFTEWTADGKLRHPTYLGLRDDVKPEAVRKEPAIVSRPAPPRDEAAERAPKATLTKASIRKLLDQLDAIEDGGGSGTLDLPGGHRLDVTNLGKSFWPKLKLTKGDLFRHYVRVAPMILPVLADRPLVMKRYPNGVSGKPFYQHRAPDAVPPGVRIETVDTGSERRPHLVGGDLMTLLYTSQLASISQDPWFSRVGAQDVVDHIAIDLDPPDEVPFARVLDVARWVREELEALKAPGFPKTSGDRKSTRLNSSHSQSSYAVFCSK